MSFYTYLWLRENGTPYYVGKGTGNRAYSKHNHFCSPPARTRVYVQHWASDEEAFEMEKWYIRFYGRKDLGTGILYNLTDGGLGAAPSEETCRKMSEANMGKVPWIKGRKHSQKDAAKNEKQPPGYAGVEALRGNCREDPKSTSRQKAIRTTQLQFIRQQELSWSSYFRTTSQ